MALLDSRLRVLGRIIMYMYMYTCVYNYICMYVYTYIYIYMYIYIERERERYYSHTDMFYKQANLCFAPKPQAILHVSACFNV